MDVPRPMREALLSQLIKAQPGAFALLDGSGNVLSTGGDLRRFGVGPLSPGENIAEALPPTFGLIPSVPGDTVIRRVHLTSSVVADLYLLELPVGYGLAVLDVTDDERREAEMAQRMNDAALLRGRLARSAEGSPGERVSPPDAVFPQEGDHARISVLAAKPCWRAEDPTMALLEGGASAVAKRAGQLRAAAKARGAIVDILIDGTVISVFGLLPDQRTPLALAGEAAREIIVEQRKGSADPDLALGVTVGEVVVGGRMNLGNHRLSVLGPCTLQAVRLADASRPGVVLLDARAAEELDIEALGGGRMQPVATDRLNAVQWEGIA